MFEETAEAADVVDDHLGLPIRLEPDRHRQSRHRHLMLQTLYFFGQIGFTCGGLTEGGQQPLGVGQRFGRREPGEIAEIVIELLVQTQTVADPLEAGNCKRGAGIDGQGFSIQLGSVRCV